MLAFDLRSWSLTNQLLKFLYANSTVLTVLISSTRELKGDEKMFAYADIQAKHAKVMSRNLFFYISLANNANNNIITCKTRIIDLNMEKQPFQFVIHECSVCGLNIILSIISMLNCLSKQFQF